MFPRLSPNYKISDVFSALLPARNNAVRYLETAFQERTRHAHAHAFRYGRSGLYYLLKALNTEKQYVLMPSYSCVVVAHAIVEAGFTPIFLDNATGSFQPDIQGYIETIKQRGDEIAMVIPTQLFGITENTKPLYDFIKAEHPHIFILQDCAHGFFCEDDNGVITTRYADGALFGMNISKLANSVKGGMLTLNDKNISKRVSKLYTQDCYDSTLKQSLTARLYVIAAFLAFHPWLYYIIYFLQKRTKLLSAQTDYYHEDTINLPDDYNGTMSAFEGEVGLSSLRNYNARIAVRQNIALAYDEVLKPYKDQGLLNYADYRQGYSWSHYPVICQPTALKHYLIETLEDNGFEIGEIVDYSIADMACYQKRGHTSCPNALHTAEHVINLPMTLGENIINTPSYKNKLGKFIKSFEDAMRDFKA